MTDSAIPSSPSAEIGSEEDLRLVLDSMREAEGLGADAPLVGRQRMPRERASTALAELFGAAPSSSASVSAFAGVPDGSIGMSVGFDLARIADELRGHVAAGIGRHRVLMDILGGVPIEVSDRLDAARGNPRLAAHLIGSAADHLVWKLRLRLQATLAPVYEDGDTLSWSGRFSTGEGARMRRLGQFLPVATTVTLDIPASMENYNA